MRACGAVVALLSAVAPATAQKCQPAWSDLGGGTSGGRYSSTVRALAVFDDGGGPALYAGGDFTTAGGVTVNGIAKWDGAAWSPLGSGVSAPVAPLSVATVMAMVVFDDGSGAALYAGGAFATAGAVEAMNIARWDGAEWAPMGSGLSGSVQALTVFDDGLGGGPALYAGGWIASSGGTILHSIAKWDGAEWVRPGGLGVGGTVPRIDDLVVFDDRSGGGPALFAGGIFETPVRRIGRWDGIAWSGLAGGGVGPLGVRALAVFDDGAAGGVSLYAGGRFDFAGGSVVNRIAKWDGAAWSALGSGMDLGEYSWVEALAVCDDCAGGGAALFAGGGFRTAGAVTANGIAKWDGAVWSALDGGMRGGDRPTVLALAEFDDGSGPALYAGGAFTTAGGTAVSNIARWSCASCYPDCDGDEQLTLSDFLCFQSEFAAMTAYADCDDSGGHDFFDFLCFQNAFAGGCP